jgi:outer membrane protein assembly factor BamD
MRPTIRNVFLCVILLYSWGCVEKTAKLQKSVVPPDKTLFETGSEYLNKSQYIKARLAFQTLMNTYPDSEMAPDAVLAIGDSYYDEGGTENYLQAEDSYKNFIVFFPTHPKAPDAALKVIALNHRMMRSPDRDQQYSFKTQDAINNFLSHFPDSDYVPIVNQYLLEVQENLALGDLYVGRFYEGKGNLAGARLRYQDIKDKYPRFSQMDDVLFSLATVQEKSNNPEEATINYGKILSAYPFSKHSEEAKARLNSLGKPIPQVDTQLAAANQSRVKEPEGFSPLKPFIEFGKALEIGGPPDIYEEAKKAVEEAKTAEAAAAGKTGEGQTGNDIQIQSVIRKSASGETQDTTTLGVAQPQPQNTEEKKKDGTRTRKKNVKKPS